MPELRLANEELNSLHGCFHDTGRLCILILSRPGQLSRNSCDEADPGCGLEVHEYPD